MSRYENKTTHYIVYRPWGVYMRVSPLPSAFGIPGNYGPVTEIPVKYGPASEIPVKYGPASEIPVNYWQASGIPVNYGPATIIPVNFELESRILIDKKVLRKTLRTVFLSTYHVYLSRKPSLSGSGGCGRCIRGVAWAKLSLIEIGKGTWGGGRPLWISFPDGAFWRFSM